MKFKKPTTLTTALSALLVVGIGSMSAFAVAPKTEDPVTVPDISEPEFTVSVSEPVTEIDDTESKDENPDPEPETPVLSPDEELELKYPRGEHSIPIFPEDKDGIYFSESGDVVRVPVRVVPYENERPLCGSCSYFKLVEDDNGMQYAHVVLYKEIPEGYHFFVLRSEEFVVMSRNEDIFTEQCKIYSQMELDGIIPYGRDYCSHYLNSHWIPF